MPEINSDHLKLIPGQQRALVVVDMPFGSYEASKEQAFMNAARVLKINQ